MLTLTRRSHKLPPQRPKTWLSAPIGGDPLDSATERFGKRLLALRKERGWSQPELAKKIDTSGAIVGRYERGEMTPSIEVAAKVAEAFRVTVDALVSERAVPDILGDQAMLERWRTLDGLQASERERILSVLDSLLRDAQARQAYAQTG